MNRWIDLLAGVVIVTRRSGEKDDAMMAAEIATVHSAYTIACLGIFPSIAEAMEPNKTGPSTPHIDRRLAHAPFRLRHIRVHSLSGRKNPVLQVPVLQGGYFGPLSGAGDPDPG